MQVLVEQEKGVIKQRRMYEENIAELEKALYAKTKEAEEAVNSAENVAWRRTVKRLLEHDTAANNRLTNQLETADALICTLQVNIRCLFTQQTRVPFS